MSTLGTMSGLPRKPPVLETKDLSLNFGGLQATSEVDFMLPSGQIRAIIGPNGAGKTTFFNLITGVLEPNSGRIFLHGKDITHLPAYARAKLGIGRSFQVVNLFPDLTVEQNVRIAIQASLKKKYGPFEVVGRSHIDRRTEDLFAKYDWIADRHIKAGALIYPEQKKLETLMALALKPNVMLLDEPTAGVDENDIWLITEMIHAVSQYCTIMLTDHDIKFVMGVADMVTVLNHGCVIAEGLPEAVAHDPRVEEIYFGGAKE